MKIPYIVLQLAPSYNARAQNSQTLPLMVWIERHGLQTSLLWCWF